jgi:hypothetical protein
MDPDATRPAGLTGAVDGFGGALVARVERVTVSLGGSGLVRRDGGRAGGADGRLSAVLEVARGRELAFVPIAGSFLG